MWFARYHPPDSPEWAYAAGRTREDLTHQVRTDVACRSDELWSLVVDGGADVGRVPLPRDLDIREVPDQAAHTVCYSFDPAEDWLRDGVWTRSTSDATEHGRVVLDLHLQPLHAPWLDSPEAPRWRHTAWSPALVFAGPPGSASPDPGTIIEQLRSGADFSHGGLLQARELWIGDETLAAQIHTHSVWIVARDVGRQGAAELLEASRWHNGRAVGDLVGVGVTRRDAFRDAHLRSGVDGDVSRVDREVIANRVALGQAGWRDTTATAAAQKASALCSMIGSPDGRVHAPAAGFAPPRPPVMATQTRGHGR